MVWAFRIHVPQADLAAFRRDALGGRQAKARSAAGDDGGAACEASGVNGHGVFPWLEIAPVITATLQK